MNVDTSWCEFVEREQLKLIHKFTYTHMQAHTSPHAYLHNARTQMFWLISAIIVMSLVVPVILAVLMPVLVLYYYGQRFYRASSVELQRLMNISRSPIQAKFVEAMNGTRINTTVNGCVRALVRIYTLHML